MSGVGWRSSWALVNPEAGCMRGIKPPSVRRATLVDVGRLESDSSSPIDLFPESSLDLARSASFVFAWASLSLSASLASRCRSTSLGPPVCHPSRAGGRIELLILSCSLLASNSLSSFFLSAYDASVSYKKRSFLSQRRWSSSLSRRPVSAIASARAWASLGW